jgi:hypothetical protein
MRFELPDYLNQNGVHKNIAVLTNQKKQLVKMANDEPGYAP